ncbi:ShlB/FhaC/HecB family hemolysin secretion/activation protein [Ectopseudomonas mendocina]|uniref:ShlB/FhaC/HecB family hemolysin secretion/activation protein n=1 Tax=Ectopseudomonas mendocina TaxID=300 RepID=A0ABZ2RG91_ECTME
MRKTPGLLFAVVCVSDLAHAYTPPDVAKPPADLRFQEAPGVDLRSTLILGATRHYTPQTVNHDTPTVTGNLEFDNYGNRYVGVNRPGSTLNLNNLLGLNDQLSFRSPGSGEGGHYYRVAYHLTAGPWDTQVGVMWADMAYELKKELTVLKAEGDVSTLSAFVIQPLIKRQDLNLNLRLQYDDKRFDDTIDLVYMRSEKDSKSISLSLNADSQDAFFGGATNQFSLGWTQGDVEISGTPYTVTGYTDEGRFDVIHASLARVQHLTPRLSLHAQVNGQWSNDSLDESEKMQIGGALGVNAYPQSEGLADSGWLASLELRYALTESWQAATFVDHGESRRNAAGLNTSEDLRTQRSGTGLGLRWAADNWYINAVAAWKLGNADATSDNDKTPRFWTQIVRYF